MASARRARRRREGGQADDDAALGRGAIAGADPGHERRLDLRSGPGRNEPGHAGAEAFPGGPHLIMVIPAEGRDLLRT